MSCAFVGAQEIHNQSNAVSLANESNSVSGWTGSSGTSLTVETNDVYDGQYAIKFEAAADGWRTGKYTFQTTAGVQYHISIHAKVVNSDHAGFWMWQGFSDFDGGQNIIPGGWNKYDFIYTGDGTLAELLVYTGHPSVTGNAILIDAVSIVPYVALTGITLSPSVGVNVGQTQTMNPVFSPSNASNKDVTWESSDTAIATVDSNGTVVAISEGVATITATSSEGGFTATSTITVSAGSGSSDNGLWTSNGDAIYNLDNVAIGRNSVPIGYKLAVEGHVRAREIKVDADAWPDYVFDKSYKLLSLEEIKKHIQENGHLPNIPSATEMEANGVELGGMNKLLLEKIEELTLHLIEQNKRIEKLNKEIINKEK